MSGIAAIVLLASLGLLTWVGLMRFTVPEATGAMTLAGLSRPVEVIYDREAVPHVLAATAADAYEALGLLHGQHRLWQMELMRRAGQGRLSELFGGATLAADMFVRTLDLYGHAERSVAALSPRGRSALQAYARGVNAVLTRPTRWFEPRFPPEFGLFWHTPEPWREADSVVIVKMMALQLGRNLDKEIDRLLLAAHGLSPDEIEHLMPTVAGGAPPLPDLRTLYPLRQPTAANLRRGTSRAEDVTSSGASNNWVVAGRRTASGLPLLANDPHLRLSAPSVWYLAHLAIGVPDKPANLVGASLPGTPLFPLGRGDTLAWGLTNTETDVQDLYIEKLDPTDSERYLTPGGAAPFTREPMTIKVRGASDVALERRSTRHGPVISGVYRGLAQVLAPGYVAALRSTALTSDDTTIEAGLFDPTFRTVADAIEATRTTVGPMQSMVVADTLGTIGLIAPGRLPIRHAANQIEGRAPVPGWLETYEWTGFVPFAELPRRLDPPEGAIATSNTRMVPPSYPYLLTHDWGPGYRQERIRELVLDRDGHDMASMRAAQLDVRSTAFAQLKPLMVRAAREAGGADTDVLNQIESWNTGMDGDSAKPLLFVAWLKHTIEGIYRDDLGVLLELGQDERVPQLVALLEHGATERDWCDDRRTSIRETCGQILVVALAKGIADLERRYGRDRSNWSWGRAHFALGEHQPLGRLPVIGDWFDIKTPSGGGPFTINRGKPNLFGPEPYASRDATTFRAIYDLADLDQSLFIQSTGQSGNPFSTHYRTFVDRWRDGGYITIKASRSAIETDAMGRWMLSPRRQ